MLDHWLVPVLESKQTYPGELAQTHILHDKYRKNIRDFAERTLFEKRVSFNQEPEEYIKQQEIEFKYQQQTLLLKEQSYIQALRSLETEIANLQAKEPNTTLLDSQIRMGARLKVNLDHLQNNIETRQDDFEITMSHHLDDIERLRVRAAQQPE